MTTRSQDQYMETGEPNSYRVRGERGNWWIEGTDNNNVWVDAEPGFRYRTKREAQEAADTLKCVADAERIAKKI
jgi:hypothetical protein